MNQLLEPTTTQDVRLEISRGKSKFRSRPVHQGRFLIGAGSTCHLQLGGDQIPMLHSVIESGDEGLAIDAIVAHPPLIINGQHRRAASLFDGDVIEIGPFEFTVRSEAAAPSIDAGFANAETEIAFEASEEISHMSASELADRIAELEEMERELEQDRERGATSLLQAIGNATQSAVPVREEDSRYDEIVTTLSMLTDQVVSQAQLFAEREQAWQQALLSVQDTQQRIISQLSHLSQASDKGHQAIGTRASA